MATVRFSNLQYNLVQQFPSSGKMSVEDFAKFDQRIASSLGKRGVPLVVRASKDEVVLTLEGIEARRLMNETDVYRSVERLTIVGDEIAHCFDHVNRRAGVRQISQRNMHRFQNGNGKKHHTGAA